MTAENRVILAHSRIDRAWSQPQAQRLERALPYARRISLPRAEDVRRRTLLGIALALALLGGRLGRIVAAGELQFPDGGKPLLAAGPDFSISHAEHVVACAVAGTGRIGLDLELEPAAPRRAAAIAHVCAPEERLLPPLEAWVAKEAAVKALGLSVLAVREARVLERHVALRGQLLERTQLELAPGVRACLASTHPLDGLDIVAAEAAAML